MFLSSCSSSSTSSTCANTEELPFSPSASSASFSRSFSFSACSSFYHFIRGHSSDFLFEVFGSCELRDINSMIRANVFFSHCHWKYRFQAWHSVKYGNLIQTFACYDLAYATYTQIFQSRLSTERMSELSSSTTYSAHAYASETAPTVTSPSPRNNVAVSVGRPNVKSSLLQLRLSSVIELDSKGLQTLSFLVNFSSIRHLSLSSFPKLKTQQSLLIPFPLHLQSLSCPRSLIFPTTLFPFLPASLDTLQLSLGPRSLSSKSISSVFPNQLLCLHILVICESANLEEFQWQSGNVLPSSLAQLTLESDYPASLGGHRRLEVCVSSLPKTLEMCVFRDFEVRPTKHPDKRKQSKIAHEKSKTKENYIKFMSSHPIREDSSERFVFPDTLTQLDWKKCRLVEDVGFISEMFPKSLTALELPNLFMPRFTWQLSLIYFPENLRKLCFPKTFNEILAVGILPKTLEFLDLGLHYSHPLIEGVLPRALIELFMPLPMPTSLSNRPPVPFTFDFLPAPSPAISVSSSSTSQSAAAVSTLSSAAPTGTLGHAITSSSFQPSFVSSEESSGFSTFDPICSVDDYRVLSSSTSGCVLPPSLLRLHLNDLPEAESTVRVVLGNGDLPSRLDTLEIHCDRLVFLPESLPPSLQSLVLYSRPPKDEQPPLKGSVLPLCLRELRCHMQAMDVDSLQFPQSLARLIILVPKWGQPSVWLKSLEAKEFFVEFEKLKEVLQKNWPEVVIQSELDLADNPWTTEYYESRFRFRVMKKRRYESNSDEDDDIQEGHDSAEHD